MRGFLELCKENKVILRVWVDINETCDYLVIEDVLVDAKGDVLGIIYFSDCDEDYLCYMAWKRVESFSVFRNDHKEDGWADEDWIGCYEGLIEDLKKSK